MSSKLFLFVAFLSTLTHSTWARPWFWNKPSDLILIECFRPEFKHLPECRIDCGLSVNIYLPECLPDCSNPKNKKLKPCKEALEEEKEEKTASSTDNAQGITFTGMDNSNDTNATNEPTNDMVVNDGNGEEDQAMTFNAMDENENENDYGTWGDENEEGNVAALEELENAKALLNNAKHLLQHVKKEKQYHHHREY